MNRILDARGKSCPLPVLEARQAAEEMQEPGLLTVYVDNEIAVQNLLKLARQKNMAAVSEKLEEKKFVVAFECPGPGTAVTEREVPGPSAEKEEGVQPGLTRAVLILDADTMGKGEEKLGQALLKSFLFAVSRQETLPGTLLCYNRGAFLTCEGSEFLEDLRVLGERGVEILTCGTCLEYYGLQEKLVLGEVTNMYEIAKKMTEASFIIRP